MKRNRNITRKETLVTRTARVAKMKLKSGDPVMVISGKDKGTQGTIARVDAVNRKVTIDGVAMYKRHARGLRGQSGSIIEKPRPIDVSNVMLMDPKEKKPTRVGRRMEDGKLVRFAKKGGVTLS